MSFGRRLLGAGVAILSSGAVAALAYAAFGMARADDPRFEARTWAMFGGGLLFALVILLPVGFVLRRLGRFDAKAMGLIGFIVAATGGLAIVIGEGARSTLPMLVANVAIVGAAGGACALAYLFVLRAIAPADRSANV